MPEEVAKSAKYVTMGCKLPNGLRMRIFKPYTEKEAVMGGGVRDVTRFLQDGESVVLNGSIFRVNENGSQNVTHTIAGGFGLTNNVPAEFAKTFMEQNKDSAFVKEGLIFIVNSEADAVKEAKNRHDVRSGMEPLDTGFTLSKDGVVIPNDPRVPKGTTTSGQRSGVTAVHEGVRE